MQSWSRRNRLRGGITQSEFLDQMRRAGFRVCADTLPSAPLFAFVHNYTGDRLYRVNTGETFSHALDRLKSLPHQQQDATT